MILVGVDPSLTATGLVILEEEGTTVRLRGRHTVRAPAKGELSERLFELAAEVAHWLDNALPRPGVVLVMEDPTDFPGGPRRSAGTAAKLGAAFGVVSVVVRHAARLAAGTVAVYPSQQWIPKQTGRRGGGWKYATPHKQVVWALRHLVPELEAATDDEVMAAGVALHHRRVMGGSALTRR